MNSIKSKSDSPLLDMADELLAFAEEHPEEGNYIEKTAIVAENYFQKPIVAPALSSRQITAQANSGHQTCKNEIVIANEQKKEIGVSIEVRPLLKNAWQNCVLL